MTEKRNVTRQRVLKRGTISFGGGGIDCTVRNLSARGARLDVASPLGLPVSFELVIEADQFIRSCRRVWTTEHQIGVMFD